MTILRKYESSVIEKLFTQPFLFKGELHTLCKYFWYVPFLGGE